MNSRPYRYLLALVAGGFASVSLAQTEERGSYSDRVVEEIVVTAPNWRKQTEPQIAEPPRWQIDDTTRVKLQSRMQLGYDPVLDEIRNADNRIKVRDNVGEPEPSTVFRLTF